MLHRRLYELLPFIYLSLSIFLIFALDQTTRWIPGIFFGLCGIMVLKWRFQERRRNKPVNETAGS